ncbi:MAG TPA: hypothetical protein VFS36_00755 [Chitinophagaceae bacterium]|jgi:hypothetical protein|nr:hypothetical protein [Chitinophagaceae bacterium]
MKKFLWILAATLVLVSGGYIYWKYFYVFGEGVKTGYLNYAVRKGDFFKTYEGKLIQQGFQSKTAGSIQSYEFEFSIANKKVFQVLEVNSGKVFDLHYKEYHGIVPWRGNTVYLVDSIVAMRQE